MSAAWPDEPATVPRARWRLPSLAALSLVLYGVSFVLPYDRTGAPGYAMFWMGMWYCWFLPTALPWWANAVILCAWLGRRPGTEGGVALAAAAATLLAATHLVWWDPVPDGPAYYCWAGSMALLAVAAWRESLRPGPPRSMLGQR